MGTISLTCCATVSGGDSSVTDVQYKRLGHFIRWVLELAVIWVYVFAETGMWTCIALTMITVGIEWDHLDLEIFKKRRPTKNI